MKPIAAIPNIAELNIGHFLVGEAIFVSLEKSIACMRALMDEARAGIKTGVPGDNMSGAGKGSAD